MWKHSQESLHFVDPDIMRYMHLSTFFQLGIGAFLFFLLSSLGTCSAGGKGIAGLQKSKVTAIAFPIAFRFGVNTTYYCSCAPVSIICCNSTANCFRALLGFDSHQLCSLWRLCKYESCCLGRTPQLVNQVQPPGPAVEAWWHLFAQDGSTLALVCTAVVLQYSD
jgi:hypothetical protein